MSIRHMNRVLDLELSPIPKLVLLIFADCANENGICWPGIQHVATRASVSERTVQRLIPTFERLGLMARRPRYGKSGRQLSSEYWLFPPNMVGDGKSPQGAKDNLAGVTEEASEGVTTDTQTTTEPTNHLVNHHNFTLPAALSATERNSALELICRLSTEDAQTVLDELAGRLSQGRIRSPISYLRMLVTRMRQGAFVPELSHGVAEQRHRRKTEVEAATTKSLTPEPNATRQLPHEHIAKHLQDMRKAITRGATPC